MYLTNRAVPQCIHGFPDIHHWAIFVDDPLAPVEGKSKLLNILISY